MDEATINRLRRLLVGFSCSAVESLGDHLQIVFPDRRLIVESAWWILTEGKILGASDSDGTRAGAIRELLVGRRVSFVEVHGGFSQSQVGLRE